MSETATHTKRKEPTKPNALMAALDEGVRGRFARRTGSLDAFLRDWIKLDDSQKQLFDTRGADGENYLQHILARADIKMALGIARTCAFFAETDSADRVVDFLNNIDNHGNDLWHYLADNLTSREDEDSLEIAKLLVQLEIDYCRKNANDESPLARLLIPVVRWASINSLLQAKAISIEEMESSFPDAVARNEQVRAELMAGIFFSDLADNDAKLTSHFLAQAVSPKADKIERARIARVLFDYSGGQRAETVLMRMVEFDHGDTLEKALAFLQTIAEDAYQAQAAGDQAAAKTNQQMFIYRRIGRRNRAGQNLIMKAVQANKPNYVSVILRHLRNEDLILAKRGPRGEVEREMVIVDKNSPAPSNPTMALLLQQDVRGNLAFHNAVLLGREDCLRKLIFGISQIDLSVILTRIPNRWGLTIQDLLSPEASHRKLTIEIRGQRLSVEDAQTLMGMVKALDKRIGEFLVELLRRAEDMLSRTGGAAVAKPTFDLMRVPTVLMAIQNGTMARPAPIAPPPGQAPKPPPR